MNAETLLVFAPCKIHRLWKDVTRECFYCMCERVAAAPPEEDSAMAGPKDRLLFSAGKERP